MSLQRATRLVEAMANRTDDGEARRLGVELVQLPHPDRVADAIVVGMTGVQQIQRGRPWTIATGVAGLIAALLGANALRDLDTVLPGEGGLFFVPLLAVPLAIVGLIALSARRRSFDVDRAEVLVRRVARGLRAVDVPPVLALEVAAYVAEVDPATARARYPVDNLDQHLAVAEVVSLPVQVNERSSRLIVGASVVWVVFGFWALLFARFGDAARIGDW